MVSEDAISYADFERVDVRVGRIERVEEFAAARKPAYKLWVDFGALGVRRSSAGITRHYRPEDLVGKLIVAVVNFPLKQIADFMSEILVLGVPDEDGEVVLLAPDREVPLGGRLF